MFLEHDFNIFNCWYSTSRTVILKYISLLCFPFHFRFYLNTLCALCLVWLRVYLSCWFFSKNQLLVLLILCTVLFVSTWFNKLWVWLFSAVYSYWLYLLLFVLELSAANQAASVCSVQFLFGGTQSYEFSF